VANGCVELRGDSGRGGGNIWYEDAGTSGRGRREHLVRGDGNI